MPDTLGPSEIGSKTRKREIREKQPKSKRAIVGTSTEWMTRGDLLGENAGSSSSNNSEGTPPNCTTTNGRLAMSKSPARKHASANRRVVVGGDRVKGPWTREEDEQLTKLVKEYGPKKWSVIAAHIPGRIGKQCRERWLNHLDSSVRKSPWTDAEDDILLREQRRKGNKWCQISKLLPGRPENAVKNRWNSLMNRRYPKHKPEPATNYPGEPSPLNDREYIPGAEGSLMHGPPRQLRNVHASSAFDDSPKANVPSSSMFIDDRSPPIPQDAIPELRQAPRSGMVTRGKGAKGKTGPNARKERGVRSGMYNMTNYGEGSNGANNKERRKKHAPPALNLENEAMNFSISPTHNQAGGYPEHPMLSTSHGTPRSVTSLLDKFALGHNLHVNTSCSARGRKNGFKNDLLDNIDLDPNALPKSPNNQMQNGVAASFVGLSIDDDLKEIFGGFPLSATPQNRVPLLPRKLSGNKAGIKVSPHQRSLDLEDSLNFMDPSLFPSSVTAATSGMFNFDKFDLSTPRLTQCTSPIAKLRELSKIFDDENHKSK